MEPRHCKRSEAIQGRHTHSLDRFVASLLAMTPYHQVMILSTRFVAFPFGKPVSAFPGNALVAVKHAAREEYVGDLFAPPQELGIASRRQTAGSRHVDRQNALDTAG